jgi:hypothetical protein
VTLNPAKKEPLTYIENSVKLNLVNSFFVS